MENVRLGDIAELITKGTTPTSIGYQFVENGVNFIKIESIDNNGIINKSNVSYITDECNARLSRSQLKENDILFSIAGAIGRVAIVNKAVLPANTNQALAIIRLGEKYNKKFFKYLLVSNYIKKQYEKRKQGVAQINLSLTDISDLQIPVVSEKQQEKIVKELEKVEKLINVNKKQIELLDELIKAKFTEMFGDPIINTKKWNKTCLKELTETIVNGNTPKGGDKVYVDEGIMFFRSQNVWKNRLEMDNIAYIDIDTHNKMKKSSLKHNDILITKTGRINTENSSLGRTAIYTGEDDKANINGHVYLVRLKKNIINHEFVLFILTSDEYREHIRNVCVGGIDKRQLNKDHIENFPIIIPPIELQEDFAKIVKKIEKQKIIYEENLKSLEELNEKLMNKYFN